MEVPGVVQGRTFGGLPKTGEGWGRTPEAEKFLLLSGSINSNIMRIHIRVDDIIYVYG